MDNNTSVKELNTLLKGEHMAISGYEKYIQSMKDVNTKGELQRIQQDHKQHAIKIAERIQNLGGRPAENEGPMGKMAQTMANIKDIGKDSSVNTILKDARDGENLGIKMADEVAKGDLDPDSAALINNILNEDRSHLSVLDNLINGTGGIKQ